MSGGEKVGHGQLHSSILNQAHHLLTARPLASQTAIPPAPDKPWALFPPAAATFGLEL